MKNVLLVMLMFFFLGCSGMRQRKIVYYDLEGVNHIPGMIWADLMRPGEYGKREPVKILGHFGTSSIEVASRIILDSPLIVTWFDANKINHEYPFPFRILPPLDTVNQKYHIRFTFYPGDSVRVQARAVAKSDCRHTIRHGATALAGSGPCVSDNGYSNVLDSATRGLLPYPTSGPLDFPEK